MNILFHQSLIIILTDQKSSFFTRTKLKNYEEKGYTLIPLEFYLKNGRVKLSLGVCKGKKQFDKRAVIKERDINRDIQREFSRELKR